MIPIKWGWRVQCNTPGCKRFVEDWSEKGIPPLPVGGTYGGGALKGWFIYHGRDDYMDNWLKHHIAYCPEHSSAGTAWMAATSKWKGDRHKVAKEATLSFLDRVAEWLSPAEKRRQINTTTGEVARAWEKTNPRPRAPWRS